jgi:hypothetical protein
LEWKEERVECTETKFCIVCIPCHKIADLLDIARVVFESLLKSIKFPLNELDVVGDQGALGGNDREEVRDLIAQPNLVEDKGVYALDFLLQFVTTTFELSGWDEVRDVDLDPGNYG